MKVNNTSEIKADKINMLIYGESGIGKSYLASTLEEKTIIVSIESGLLSLKNFDIDYVNVSSVDSLISVMKEVESSDYVNVYIDSLSAIGDLFFQKAKEKYPQDKNTMQRYGYQLDVMSGFIRYCRDINKNIFFTALEKTASDEVGKRFKSPDLQGSISVKAAQYFDFVFNYTMMKAEQKEYRALITQKTDDMIAKDRSGALGKICEPNLQKIINKVFIDAPINEVKE